MKLKCGQSFTTILLALVGLSLSVSGATVNSGKPAPLVIQEQGSFAVGGSTLKARSMTFLNAASGCAPAT